VDINLPRPRNAIELESSPDFVKYRRQLLDLVRVEARKSFQNTNADAELI
jgi:hypothetical protein